MYGLREKNNISRSFNISLLPNNLALSSKYIIFGMRLRINFCGWLFSHYCPTIMLLLCCYGSAASPTPSYSELKFFEFQHAFAVLGCCGCRGYTYRETPLCKFSFPWEQWKSCCAAECILIFFCKSLSTGGNFSAERVLISLMCVLQAGAALTMVTIMRRWLAKMKRGWKEDAWTGSWKMFDLLLHSLGWRDEEMDCDDWCIAMQDESSIHSDPLLIPK